MKRGDPITPETRIGALLGAYPELEDVLVALSPRFEKLKNPLLRRTVAKVASLSQAAAIGDVPVPKLVAALRAAAGQDVPPMAGTTSPAAAPADPPPWVENGVVVETVDADAMLATGVHPLGHVRERAAGLDENQVLCIDAGFRPAPLIDTLAAAGHRVWCGPDTAGRFRTYVGSKS